MRCRSGTQGRGLPQDNIIQVVPNSMLALENIAFVVVQGLVLQFSASNRNSKLHSVKVRSIQQNLRQHSELESAHCMRPCRALSRAAPEGDTLASVGAMSQNKAAHKHSLL